MAVRPELGEPGFFGVWDAQRGDFGEDGGCVQDGQWDEVVPASRYGGDDVAGLGQVRGAGHVGHHTAGPDRVDRRVEQLALQAGQFGHVSGGLAPPGFGAAAQRSEAGARDIGQDTVERTRAPRHLAPVRGQDGGGFAARAAQGFQDALRPVRADVRGDQAGAAGGGEAAQQPGLAAGARAQVEPELVAAG